MPGSCRLAHIALPVADPPRSARFYSDLIGLRVLYTSPEAAFLSTDGALDLLAFSRSDLTVPSSREGMHFGFVVDPDLFDRLLHKIEDLSIHKLFEPDERDIGRYVFIQDPDGYTVEIFEHDKAAWR